MELFMLNQQPPEGRVTFWGALLDVFEIFPTIQGEGPYAGRPAIFVRLAGCNLQCPACDTDYTSKRGHHTVEGLANKIEKLAPRGSLVVVTGGEPFRQDCGHLVGELAKRSPTFCVQFETNGTQHDPSMDGWWHAVKVICSPKTPKIHPKMVPVISAYKYVLEAGKVADDGLPTSALQSPFPPARPPSDRPPWETYIQPLDVKDPAKNKANLDAAVKSSLEYGYTLCLQLHKIINLP